MLPGSQIREGSQETALAEEFSGSCTALDDRKLRLHFGAALFGIRPGDTLLVLGDDQNGVILSRPEVLHQAANRIFNNMERKNDGNDGDL